MMRFEIPHCKYKNCEARVDTGDSFQSYPQVNNHEATTYKTPPFWEGDNQNKSKTVSEWFYGHKLYHDDFIDGGGTGEYSNDGTTTETGVFGAVMRQPPKFGEITGNLVDEFDILGRMLNRNSTKS